MFKPPLSKDLLDGKYRPDALLRVGIPKDDGRVRWLSIPAVRDRVVQTAAAMWSTTGTGLPRTISGARLI